MCGWMLCLGIYSSYAALDVPGVVHAMWPPISAFVMMGFEHAVANMFLIPTAIW